MNCFYVYGQSVIWTIWDKNRIFADQILHNAREELGEIDIRAIFPGIVKALVRIIWESISAQLVC